MKERFYINRDIDGHPICVSEEVGNDSFLSKKEIVAALNYMDLVTSWISVEDSPHPLGINFIAFYGKSYIKRIDVVYFECSRELNITHWMPLPDVPLNEI